MRCGTLLFCLDDANGLGEALRNLFHVAKTSQNYFHASQISTVGLVKSFFGEQLSHAQEISSKTSKNDR